MFAIPTNDSKVLSEAELERMIAQYGDGLLRMCLLYLKDYASAEDAVQETFLRAYKSYATFEGRSSEKTWLTAIAVNVCKNILRSPWHKRNAGEAALEKLQYENPEMGDPTVSRAILRLPTEQRTAVILFYVQGLKIREIAKVMKVPTATISSRLSRAREKLRTELKEWYFDED